MSIEGNYEKEKTIVEVNHKKFFFEKVQKNGASLKNFRQKEYHETKWDR